MQFKTFRVAELKATPDDGPGSFRAIVAVFGNVDEGGDRMERGAFKRTLEERGLPPIVWSHQWETPPIGSVQKAEERQEGLYIKGRLFVGDDEDSPMARAVYTAMKATDGNGAPVLREFSFGYAARDYSIEGEDGDQIRVLKDVDLFEVGPTLVGMNPATRLIGVKAMADELQHELQRDSSAEQKDEPDDKPDPNDRVSEEERARINQLLASKPIHAQEG